jgi:O-antigen/teichoic acid export membrane protein
MSLKRKAVAGVIWNSIGTIGAGCLHFGLIMILARMLTPSDFGRIELLVIFTVISQSFIDGGFSQALIRDRNTTQKDLSTIFFLNLFIALFIYVILFFLAPHISHFYEDSSLIKLSRFVFTVIIFYSLSIVQNAIYSKKLEFKPIAIVNILSLIISGSVSVWMAYNGYTVWALAVSLVLLSFSKMILFWALSSWVPTFVFSFNSVKKYFKFGSYLLLNTVLDKIVSNLESLFIGRVYSKADLGYFSQARKINGFLIQTPSGIVQKVAYPTMSSIQHEKGKLKRSNRKLLQVNVFITMPMSFFIFAMPESIIYSLFGSQWIVAAPYLQLWIIIGFLVGFYTIFINIFLVFGKSKELLKIGLLRQTLRIISVLVLSRISIMAILYGVLVVTMVSVCIYVNTGRKLIGYEISEIIHDLAPIFVISFMSVLVVYILDEIYLSSQSVMNLILQSSLMVLVYITIMVLTKNMAYRVVKDTFLSFIGKKGII